MKALVYHGNKDIRLENREKPIPEFNEALIKIKYTSLCATDIEEWQYGPLWVQTETPNLLSGKMAPLVMGHEIGGEVVDVSNPKNKNFIGKRVAINNILVCGICYWCKSGHHAVCPSMAVAGLSADGGLQEYMTWPVTHLVPVPNNVLDKHISLSEPATVAVHGVRRSNIKPGNKAAVVGCGTIGLLTLQVLIASGVEVIALDIKEENLKLAQIFGAKEVIKVVPNDNSFTEKILQFTNGIGADYVFETAGAKKTPEIAINLAKRGGTIVLLGIYTRKPQFDFNQIVGVEKTIIGSVASSINDMSFAVKMIGNNKINVDPLISSTIKLSNVIENGFAKMLHKDKNIYRILVDPS